MKKENKMNRKMERKIVAFGDSLTFGYGLSEEDKWTSLLQEELGIRVINAGINGNTSAQGLSRLRGDVLAHQPDFVVINFGMNDHVLQGRGRATVPLEGYKDNMSQMLRQIRESKAAAIVVVPHRILEGDRGDREGKGATYYYRRHHPLWYDPAGGANEQLKKYGNAVKAIASRENLPLVDMYAYSEQADPHSYLITLENAAEDDGVHLNPQGARLYAGRIKEKLVELLQIQTT